MEKIYSREAFEHARTEEESKKLLEQAHEEALQENEERNNARAEQMINEHRTISDEEVRGDISDDEILGTPLSPDEKRGIDKKEE